MQASIRRLVGTALAAVMVSGLIAAPATGQPTRTLVPIGSDYEPDTLGLFARAAAARTGSGRVDLVVLPITYATAAYRISAEERAENLELAGERRAQVQDACDAVTRRPCRTALAPVLVRRDASRPSSLGLFHSRTRCARQARVRGGLAAVPGTTRVLRAAWRAGAALLADNAAAALMGDLTTTNPTPTDDSLEEDAAVDFLVGEVRVRRGLGFLPGVAAEPQVVYDRHWGRLYNLVARRPSMLGLGVDFGTAVEIARDGARVRGDSAAVVLDGRDATFATGRNGALGARFVILDTYAGGNRLTARD